MPIASFAEKVLTGITDEDGYKSKIEYNELCKVLKIVGYNSDFSGLEVDWSQYQGGRVVITMFTEEGPMPLIVTVDNKGRALKVTDHLSGTNFYEFSYDSNDNLVWFKEEVEGYSTEKNLTWETGNIVKINGVEDGNTAITIDINYTDTAHPMPIENKGEVVGGVYVFVSGVDDVGLLSFLQLMGFIGNRPKNLPFYAVSLTAGESPYDYSFDYVLDSDGYPVEVIEKENDETLHNYYTWGEIELGIEDAVSGERKPVGVYDINGVKLSEHRKGINIVRYSDGSCEKVVVK